VWTLRRGRLIRSNRKRVGHRGTDDEETKLKKSKILAQEALKRPVALRSFTAPGNAWVAK